MACQRTAFCGFIATAILATGTCWAAQEVTTADQIKDSEVMRITRRVFFGPYPVEVHEHYYLVKGNYVGPAFQENKYVTAPRMAYDHLCAEMGGHQKFDTGTSSTWAWCLNNTGEYPLFGFSVKSWPAADGKELEREFNFSVVAPRARPDDVREYLLARDALVADGLYDSGLSARVNMAKEPSASRWQPGDDSHCGMVIEVRGRVVQVQTRIGPYWFRTEQLKSEGSTPCEFNKGLYVDPERRPDVN